MAVQSRNRIFFIPGKNPKPPAAEHQAWLWRCLLSSIRQVDAALIPELCASPDNFQLVAWNEIYYQQTKASEDDAPWIEAMLAKAGPDARDRREALSWRRRWVRLHYTLADFFPFLIPLFPDPAAKNMVLETERYFNNHAGTADQIRELLKAPLRRMLAAGDRILLIGHSMGSIIAYDALWELWHAEKNPGRIDRLLTLGSPLGMRFVQNRLLGFHNGPDRRFPGNIRHWINIAAQGDLTALDPNLRDDFASMLNAGMIESITDVHDIYTYFRNQGGLNVHRSYGYLAHPYIGRVVADWWRADKG